MFQKLKNSAVRPSGARSATMARPADCEEPIAKPARFAASQKSGRVVAPQAQPIMATQTRSVSPRARLWPIRSCRYPNPKAPIAAVMLTRKTRRSVSVVVKPITSPA